MYYKSLISIKDFLYRTTNTQYSNNKDILIGQLDKLDNWLISKPQYKTKRLSSNEFANDSSISSEIALTLFMAGYESKIFDYFFEIRDIDSGNYLGSVSKEEYNSLITQGSISKFIEDEQENVIVTYDMVSVWFELLIFPNKNFLVDNINTQASSSNLPNVTKPDEGVWEALIGL